MSQVTPDQRLIQLMSEGGRGGRLVNMGSLTGITGFASMLGTGHYATFKAAVVGKNGF